MSTSSRCKISFLFADISLATGYFPQAEHVAISTSTLHKLLSGSSRSCTVRQAAFLDRFYWTNNLPMIILRLYDFLCWDVGLLADDDSRHSWFASWRARHRDRQESGLNLER